MAVDVSSKETFLAKTYDTAVIGLGAIGSATLYNLAERGSRVIGLERFEPGHDRGSSHGESRIIRLSYHEDLSYVPLLHRAYEEWRAFETVDGGEPGSLMTITGILEAGHPGSSAVANSLAAARHHGLPHTELDAAAIARRFPAFRLPADWHGQFQPDGGFLRPEAGDPALRGGSAEARRHGSHRHPRAQRSSRHPVRSCVYTDDDVHRGRVRSSWRPERLDCRFRALPGPSSLDHAAGRRVVSAEESGAFHAGALPRLHPGRGGGPLLRLPRFRRNRRQGGLALARREAAARRRAR